MVFYPLLPNLQGMHKAGEMIFLISPALQLGNLCFFHVLTHEHHQKTDRQQNARDPDALFRVARRQYAAASCAERKHTDHCKISHRLLQDLLVVRVEIGAQRVRAAAHVADAHRARVSVTAHLAEGLHLHGADE